MTKQLVVLLLFSSNCFANYFGYQSADGQPEVVISANFIKFAPVEIYPDAAQSRFSDLNEYVLCAKNKDLDECYPIEGEGVNKNYRTDDRFLLGQQKLVVDGYLKWGDNITYSVNYQPDGGGNDRKGIITMNCSGEKCYPLNSLSDCQYTGCSTSAWTILAAIMEVHADGKEISKTKGLDNLSSFTLLSDNNDITVYMDVDVIKPESTLAQQYRDLTNNIINCSSKSTCNEEVEISELLGKNYDSHLFVLHEFQDKTHKFSGQLFAPSVVDILEKSEKCEAVLRVEVLDTQMIISECSTDNRRVYLVSQYENGSFKYDYKTEYVVFLMSSKAFSYFVDEIHSSGEVPYNQKGIVQEDPIR